MAKTEAKEFAVRIILTIIIIFELIVAIYYFYLTLNAEPEPEKEEPTKSEAEFTVISVDSNTNTGTGTQTKTQTNTETVASDATTADSATLPQPSTTQQNLQNKTENNKKKEKKPMLLTTKILIAMIGLFIIQLILEVAFSIYALVIHATLEHAFHWLNQILQPWYVTGRCLMIILFLVKLHTLFHDTMLEIKVSTLKILAAIDIIIVAIIVTQSLMKIVIPFAPALTLGIALIYFLVDIIISVIMLFLFKNRLKKLYVDVGDELTADNKIRNLANKYTYLYLFIFYSSLVISILAIILSRITEKYGYFRAFWSNFMIGTDAVINLVCAYYSMSFASSQYTNKCMKAERCCLSCCCCQKSAK